MLAGSISAAQSAVPSVAKNVNFNGKIQISKNGPVFDTKDLPPVQYEPYVIRIDDNKPLYVKMNGKFLPLETKKTPVYMAQEPCLERKSVSSDYTDCFFQTPDGKKINLGTDNHGHIYTQAHELLQKARSAKTDKPILLDFKA